MGLGMGLLLCLQLWQCRWTSFIFHITTGAVITARWTSRFWRTTAATHLFNNINFSSQFSFNVIQLWFRWWVVLRGRCFRPSARLIWGSILRSRLRSSHCLWFQLSLDFTASFSSSFLHLYTATELLKHKLSSVMVNDKYTVLLIWPFVPFEHSHWWGGAWNVWQRYGDLVTFSNL